MGRPINKRFFGNLNTPPIGGESVNAITVSNTGSNYSQGTVVTINTPQLSDGSPATITYSINAAGNITVTKTGSGSGYTSAALTVTTATGVSVAGTGTTGESLIYVTTSNIKVGMLITGTGVGTGAKVATIGAGRVGTLVANDSTVTGTISFVDGGTGFASSVSLTNANQNAIAFNSYLLAKDGGSSAVAGGDIIKQEASRRYTVKNSQGTGQVKLVTTATLTAGTMSVIATDVNGSTYFVKKLTARRAVLVRKTVNGSFEYANNQAAGWTLGSASTGTVSIASN